MPPQQAGAAEPGARREGNFDRALLAACGAAYAWLYGWRLLRWIARGWGDQIVYMRAGDKILHGISPYAEATWNYPPIVGYLFAPLAALPYVTAAWLWFAAQQVCLLFAAAWTWRALRARRGGTWAVALTWTAAGAIEPQLREGQINVVLLVLLCFVMWPPGRREGAAAAALGAAAAIKIWPGLLWAGDFLLRRWRRLALGLVWCGALVALPLALMALSTEGPLRPQKTAWLGTPAFLDLSLPAVVLRLRDPIVPGAALLPTMWVIGNQIDKLQLSRADERAAAVTAIAVLAVGLGLLYLRLRGASRGDTTSMTAPVAAALIALALLAAPISWPHHQVVQLPGTAALALELLRRRSHGLLILLAVAFLVPQWTYTVVMGPYFAAIGAQATAPITAWALTTLPAVAMAVLFGLHLHGLRGRPETTTTDG
jgi:hypothetical protein